MESRTSPGKGGSVQPISESRVASACGCFLEYTPASAAEDGSLVA